MIQRVVLRCAGGCGGRMSEADVDAQVAVVCLTVDETGALTGTLTLAVCADCEARGGRERAEIAVLNARAKLADLGG